LELPIDHFRLLGVSPTTDGQTVLRTLQQRLDRVPDQGFTLDTLQARADLLRASAELLADEQRRHLYETELTAIAGGEGASIAALEIPPSKEVAGLLLLMEAGQALEAFEQAHRGLQPPQAPALGSSREADLTLLAGLACQAAARDFAAERRYEAAARTLQQGLQLLQRMGQMPEQRRKLEQERDTLLPYRVLDLLSRDLSATQERAEGLALLEQLVQKRGGLEGEADPGFPAAEFQPFFKQIRPFLTVQEQVDLFSRWAQSGSSTADFLASHALTAAGFVQRKPERVRAAHDRLQASGQAGVEPFLACQQLLLGDIDAAESLFAQGAGEELRQWASEQGDGPLAGLCAYCRDWLSREVLPGFRDIEAEADLEAWFADRDVQAYVEQQDRIRARAVAAVSGSSANASGGMPGQFDALPPWPPLGDGLPASDAAADLPAEQDEESEDDSLWDGPFWAGWSLPALPAWAAAPGWKAPVGVAAAVAAIAAGSWLALRPRAVVQPIPVQPVPVQPVAEQPAAQQPATQQPAAPAPKPAAKPDLPLTATTPTQAQLRTLLEAWLASKAAVLAGSAPAQNLAELARPGVVAKLESQQSANASRSETESVKASVQSFSITEQSPSRVAAEVALSYSDERRNASGQVIGRTPSSELRNTYVFARDGDTWRLAAFRPSP
jgi:hypothetical protein